MKEIFEQLDENEDNTLTIDEMVGVLDSIV
jgi:hypothetical protein